MADIIMLPYGDGAGKKIHKSLYQTDRKALVFASGDTVKSFTIDATAEATLLVFEMPTFSGAVVTGGVSIENSDSKQIYNKTAMGETETHVRTIDVPLVGENTVTVTLSTDPLSDGTCYVSFYVKGA